MERMSIHETEAGWRPRTSAENRETVVGRPILDRETASPRDALGELRRTNERRAQDADIFVARMLQAGRDPETYWRQLSAEYDRRSVVRERPSGTYDPATGLERDTVRRLRLEMNALIPRLAEARVREDAARFAQPDFYVRRLSQQLAEVQRESELARGDEQRLRIAIDRARILREQLAFVQKTTARQDGWRLLRARAVRGTGSVLEDLAEPAPVPPWKAELTRLEAERAKLKFWQVFKKADLDDQIFKLKRREQYEAKKAATVAGR